MKKANMAVAAVFAFIAVAAIVLSSSTWAFAHRQNAAQYK